MIKPYRRNRKSAKKPKIWRKRLIWGVVALAALILVANGAMWLIYRDRVLPNVSLGREAVGGLMLDELDDEVQTDRLLASEVELRAEGKTEKVAVSELGVSVDWETSRERLASQRSWFPLLNLVAHRTVPVELKVDKPVFDAKREDLAQAFHKNPLPERVVFRGENFEIAKPEPGYQMDKKAFARQVLSDLKAGKQVVVVPTQTIDAPEATGGLDEELQSLRKKLQVNITFKFNEREIQPSAADIGKWFAQDGQTMEFSAAKADEYVKNIDSTLFNYDDAASAAGYALDNLADITFVLATEQAPVKYTYCVNLKDVNESHRTGFIRKVAAVLGDPRGWNAGGQVAFQRVDGGCDFDLWLSAPGQMTSFGGLCDPFWSCRSGRNVVINFDRWQGATDAWNNAGGSLEDYRVMVTNHEVGHWLGFGHRSCPGPGQPAPVMMQQSIDLRGCAFNPWPVAGELAAL